MIATGNCTTFSCAISVSCIMMRSAIQHNNITTVGSANLSCLPWLLCAVQLVPAMCRRASLSLHSLRCLKHGAKGFAALPDDTASAKVSTARSGWLSKPVMHSCKLPRQNRLISPNKQASSLSSSNNSAWHDRSHSTCDKTRGGTICLLGGSN